MSFLRQTIHWKSIGAFVGLLLHVPAAMAAISLVVAALFHEWISILPFAAVAMGSGGIGQLLYRLFKKEKTRCHLWDAMIIAAIGWLFCSSIAALPFYWIAHGFLYAGTSSSNLLLFSQPINALFEAFSGFTSTGLTMLQLDGFFPYSLYWWRSLLQWTGGLGLVVFILSMTHLNKQGYELYYAEARSEQMTSNITRTAHWIWAIYLIYSCITLLLFWVFGMTFWQALNHAMTVISTGGLTLSNESFSQFSLPIQIIAISAMVIASISFGIHYQMIRENNWKIVWKNLEHRMLFFLLFGGWGLMILINFVNSNFQEWVSSFFEWTSALTTCGFYTVKLSVFSPMAKLFLILGMFIGGAAGSTCGGIKIKRFLSLLTGVLLRLKTITTNKEKTILKSYKQTSNPSSNEPSGIDLPKSGQSQRLYTASVLFFVWCVTQTLGWFLFLLWTPKGRALDALFEVTSAVSNVGLTSGLLTPDLPHLAKGLFMFLMWIGRLEIIPALILILSLPIMFKPKKKK